MSPPTKSKDTKNPYPPSDPATRYAWDVVNRRIVAGDLAIRACQRHLDDMETGPKRGLFWKPERAKEALDFFPAVLRVTAGAVEGQPFNLPSYTTFVVGSLFGWTRADSRLRFREAWIEAAKGSVKALDVATPIATPAGWTTMGDLKAGDMVFDENGKICIVTHAHEIRSDCECYAVRFDDGSEIVAEAGHLWRTWDHQTRKSYDRLNPDGPAFPPKWAEWVAPRGGIGVYRAGERDEMRLLKTEGLTHAAIGCRLGRSASAIQQQWRRPEPGLKEISPLTTAEIAESVRSGHGYNHCIPTTLALKLPDADLPIDPYVLGYLLGDGDSRGTGRVACHPDDRDWIIAEFGRRGVQAAPYTSVGHFGVMGLASIWRELGLRDDKHIPTVYLRSSAAQRIELLQGLIDSDGCVDNHGIYRFSNTNERLVCGFEELVNGLGCVARTYSRLRTRRGVKCRPSWDVLVAAGAPIARLPRKSKSARHIWGREQKSRRIVSCERVPSVPVRCITVDSPSQMFLAGRALVPTHNSPVSAACGLYMMAFRGIARAECYAIAKDRNQANVLFADAVAMANAPIVGYDDGTSLVSCGTLIARGTGEMTWMLEHPASGSKFRALAGDEKVSGPRPSLVAADEIHEWRNDGPLRMWRSSGAKMPGDFLLLMTTNTPAADQLVGTEYSARYQRILRGEIDDDAAFAYIARVDEEDDPINDEACWLKAMPCLDLTFPRDNVRIEVNSSKHSMGTLLNTKRLYFGIPVGASEYWIDLDAWEAVQGRVDEEEMTEYPCWLGMDLALKNDLTALGATWRDDDGKFHATVRYWKPSEGLALKAIEDNAPYVEWAAAKPPLLLLTPGKSIEYDFVAAEVERFCSKHKVEAMAFDPAHIDQFRQACDRIGFKTWIWLPGEPAGDGLKMVVHSQGRANMHSKRSLWMPRSLGQFEDAILTGTIVVDESQLTKWCAGNAACEADQQGNRYFVKKNTRGRKDGMDALAMAIGAALSELGAEPEPEYSMFFVGGGAGQGARPPRGFA